MPKNQILSSACFITYFETPAVVDLDLQASAWAAHSNPEKTGC